MNAMDLRKKRLQLGLKQCEVAQKAGIPVSRLCAGENGYIVLRPDELESAEVALRHLATARAAVLQRELVS
jgi:transcriptional regulator with XRE-family HTH domain